MQAALTSSALMLICSIQRRDADGFYLRNGEQIAGTVIRTNGIFVTVKTRSGIQGYKYSEFSVTTRQVGVQQAYEGLVAELNAKGVSLIDAGDNRHKGDWIGVSDEPPGGMWPYTCHLAFYSEGGLSKSMTMVTPWGTLRLQEEKTFPDDLQLVL